VVDETDAFHLRAVALLRRFPGPLVLPILAVGEAAYLIQRRLGTRAELIFLAMLAEGDLMVADVPPLEWLRIGELVSGYRDLPLGTVDASVVAAAERLGVTEVATTDRRHFTVVRPRHCDAFALPLLD
jgi:predicted nucleic acid-binding protein